MGLNAVSEFMLSQIFMDESSQPNETRQVSMLFHVFSRKCGGNATLMESYMCLNKLKERKAPGGRHWAKGTEWKALGETERKKNVHIKLK